VKRCLKIVTALVELNDILRYIERRDIVYWEHRADDVKSHWIYNSQVGWS
jgi:hypothetical protein